MQQLDLTDGLVQILCDRTDLGLINPDKPCGTRAALTALAAAESQSITVPGVSLHQPSSDDLGLIDVGRLLRPNQPLTSAQSAVGVTTGFFAPLRGSLTGGLLPDSRDWRPLTVAADLEFIISGRFCDWFGGGTMLVLSRKQDEKIIIGDSITLMVISIQGDKVRLGIEAPKHVSIHREEVYQAIQRERGEEPSDRSAPSNRTA
jgi:carbon storage regulator